MILWKQKIHHHHKIASHLNPYYIPNFLLKTSFVVSSQKRGVADIPIKTCFPTDIPYACIYFRILVERQDFSIPGKYTGIYLKVSTVL
jgi:hypothetical protein